MPAGEDGSRAAGVVFVTRKYPPSVGGMETLSAGVWRSLRADAADDRLIAHGGPNRSLGWWLPLAMLRLAVALATGRDRTVLTGDALTWAAAEPVVRLFRRRGATMVMGLDMTFPNRFYRALVHPALRRADHVIAISEASARQAGEVGVDPRRVSVLRLGVSRPDSVDRDASRAALGARLAVGQDAFVIATLGRLVRRKGVRWFVEHVMPRLPAHVHYAVGGDGPELEPIARAASAAGVSARVHLLGRLDGAGRESLLAGADLFVQPNVTVPGDMEGFGLVIVEAAMRGTLVVASALDGIRDAVVEGETGLLLPTGAAEEWAELITALAADANGTAEKGARFGRRAEQLYGEDQMGRALRELLALYA